MCVCVCVCVCVCDADDDDNDDDGDDDDLLVVHLLVAHPTATGGQQQATRKPVKPSKTMLAEFHCPP